MGNCESEERKRNRMVDKELQTDFDAQKKIVKLLLLGASEGGKSTILKQMKIIHDNGFTDEERLKKRNAVYSNIILAMAIIVNGMKKLGLAYSVPEVENAADKILAVIRRGDEDLKIGPELHLAIKTVWEDKTVQEEAVPRGNEFQFIESCPHFLGSLDRICSPDYIPTTQDILMLRISTTGIVEVNFEIKKVHFRVFDVGGQRSERKKWIHCFDDVHAIIFVVAISEFDQVLNEDQQTVNIPLIFSFSYQNRMIESLRLFRSVANSKWFYNTAMILFLNKKDLFTEKIKKNSIKILFKNYGGPNTYDEQIKYIEDKFEALNSNPNKVIYMHETCATDTNQIQLILDNVIDLLLQKILHGYGLY